MKIYFVFGIDSREGLIDAYATSERYDAKFALTIIGEEHFGGSELVEGDVSAEEVDEILSMNPEELINYYYDNHSNFSPIDYYLPDEE